MPGGGPADIPTRAFQSEGLQRTIAGDDQVPGALSPSRPTPLNSEIQKEKERASQVLGALKGFLHSIQERPRTRNVPPKNFEP